MEKKFNNSFDDLINIKDDLDKNSEDYKDLIFANKIYNLYTTDDELKEELKVSVKRNKRKIKISSKIAVAAALLIFVTPFTNFGQELITTVKTLIVPSGKISVTEEKFSYEGEDLSYAVPNELKEKVYDKEGNLLTSIKRGDKFYNDKREEVTGVGIDEKSGNVKIYTDSIENSEYEFFDSIDDYKKELSFNPLVLGGEYKFIRGEKFIGTEGKSEYATLVYNSSNNRKITIFERVSSPENAYSISTEDKIQELDIDGVKIIYFEKGTFEFERDGLLVSISAKGASLTELKTIYNDLTLYK